MDDFTQRLLEKKNARKRKQEEASVALKNISLQSDRQKSPAKRAPLVEKNEGHTREILKNPKPTPRTDSREAGRALQSENRKEEPAKNARRPSNKSDSKVSNNGNESIQERMIRLRTQSNNFEDDIVESKRKRNFGHENADEAKHSSSNSHKMHSSQKVEKSSGSVSDRLAMFETQRIDSGRTGKAGQLDANRANSSRPGSNSSRFANTSVGDNDSTHKQSGKVRKTSSRKYVSSSVSNRIDLDSVVDQSCSLDFDSDENPFDVSAILKEADKAEQRESQQDEYAKSSWSVTDYLTDDSPKINIQLQENKRESVYSIDGNGEELSVFAKQIAKKQRAIKSPNQQAMLTNIDAKVSRTCLKVEDAVAADTSAEILNSKEEKKDSKHHRVNVKDAKRRAPRCPNEKDSEKCLKEIPKEKGKSESAKSESAREELGAEKYEQRKPPPKPARKQKDISEMETKMAVDNDMPARKEKALLEKEREAKLKKDERKKRAREEQDKRNAEDFQARDVVMQKADEKRKTHEQEDVAKRARHVDKVRPSEDNCQSLPDIDERDALYSSDAPADPAEMMFSPNSKTYKSVREKKSAKPKKSMRRSMSFSEGQPPLMAMHKSGYNEEASSRYNVVTTCVPTKEEKMSNSEKIKDLLDYAVSQQNIVIQASQALNMGLQGEEKKGSPEIVEGERLLLLATERRTACLDEVERLKHDNPSGNLSGYSQQNESCPPCKADLIISDIRLPLNGDFLLALRAGRMDLGVFHFVVLIQYGPKQIFSTKVRCTYDELSRNFLTFKDKIEIKNVSHDFVLTVKVFGMHTKRGGDSIPRGKKQQQTKDSPGLMKNVFSSLTPRRRVNSADDSPVRGSSPKPVFRTTNFTPCGNTKLNLAMVKSGKHALTKVPKNCPLEGFVELNLDCQPRFTASARGFLTLLEEVGEYTAWNRRWCVMQGDSISFWRFPDEETTKPSVGSIDLMRCISNSIDMIPRMECSRPNTFELIVKRPLGKHDVPSLLSTIQGNEMHIKNWVSADNKEDRVAWIDTLNRQLSDSKAWSVIKPRAKVYQPHDKNVKYPNAVAV